MKPQKIYIPTLLVILVLVLTACLPDEPPAAGTAAPAGTSRPAAAGSDPAAVIETFHERFAAGDIDAAMALVAEDVVLKVLPYDAEGPGVQGSSQVRELLEGSVQDHYRLETTAYRAAGDRVTFEYSGTGDQVRELNVGPQLGIAEALVQDGKIKSIVYTDDPEWVKKADAVGLVQAYHTEFNAGNADGALDVLADGVVMKIIYGKSDDPILEGKDTIREIIHSSSQDHFKIETGEYQVSGGKVTFRYSGIGDGLQALGAGPEVGTAEAIIRDGKIQALTYTADLEWVAKADAAEHALANTGGSAQTQVEAVPLPTLAAGETVLTQAGELAGIWRGAPGESGDPSVLWNFTPEGTYRAAFNLQQFEEGYYIEIGEYAFDGTVLTLTAKAKGCTGPEGTGMYEVRVTRREGQPDRLRFLVLDEPCLNRQRSLTTATLPKDPTTE